MADDEQILTKIDELINLLLEKKKIDISQAAKVLNESEDEVILWARALEQEGLVKIDYVLTKTVILLAKGADVKILKHKGKNIERQSVTILAKAEQVAKGAEDTSSRISKLEVIVKKMDELLAVDAPKFQETRERIDKLRDDVTSYVDSTSGILDTLSKRADELTLKLDKQIMDINVLKDEINKGLDEEKIANARASIRALLGELDSLISESDFLGAKLKDYDRIVAQFAQRPSITPERLQEMSALIAAAGQALDEFYSVRDEMSQYASVLGDRMASAENTIKSLETINAEVKAVYEKAARMSGSKDNGEQVVRELSERVISLKQELSGLRDKSLEVASWLTSDQLDNSVKEWNSAFKEQKKNVLALDGFVDDLAEIRPEISRVLEETEIYKKKVMNELNDLTAEVNDLAFGLEDIEKHAEELRKHSLEMAEVRQRVDELSSAKNEIFTSVDKLRKELSIISMKVSDLEHNRGQEKEPAGKVAQQVYAGVPYSQVTESEVERSTEQVSAISSSYNRKREVVEEMLKAIWEKEKDSFNKG